MTEIIPVILAGGEGSRLWPLSRKSYPKQFSTLVGKNTLFQESVLRLFSSDQIYFDKHIILTNSDFRFVVAEQLQQIDIDPGPILIEPESKNTGPAILAATLFAKKNNEDPILLISPSDHIISDIPEFHRALSEGIKEVKKGKIVCFGVPPTGPETAYGYLSLSKKAKQNFLKVKKFIEKPDENKAKAMFEAGTYLWNSGIFMFRSKDILKAFEMFAPSFIEPVRKSIIDGIYDLGFFRLDPKQWAKCDNLSIDYAIMEKLKKLVGIPLQTKWSDLGAWNSVWEEMEKDANGVVTSNNAYSIESKDSLLRSESKSQVIVGLGLENIIAIAMRDAVLVMNKNKAQNVKAIVSKLKSHNIKQAEYFSKDFRPWGWFEVLGGGENFKIKKIFLKPNSAISLQKHHHRAEHWIVVKGYLKVTIEKEIKTISEGESVYIPCGSIHRMENTGNSPTLIIEVQTGKYLGEDDIVRYEDIYNRK